MLPKYKRLTRTTLRELKDVPFSGVYIVAYMGRVLYIGQSDNDVVSRLKHHLYRRDTELLGGWMYKVRDDWHNVRVDVLETPDDVNSKDWLQKVESVLVRKFTPLFNDALQK